MAFKMPSEEIMATAKLLDLEIWEDVEHWCFKIIYRPGMPSLMAYVVCMVEPDWVLCDEDWRELFSHITLIRPHSPRGD